MLCAQRLVGNQPFAVLLADDLMVGNPPVLKQMVDQYAEWRASILAVQEVPPEQTRRYGIVAGTSLSAQLVDVNRIVEKPAADVAPSRLAVAGRYILTPGVFHEIANLQRGVGGDRSRHQWAMRGLGGFHEGILGRRESEGTGKKLGADTGG